MSSIYRTKVNSKHDVDKIHHAVNNFLYQCFIAHSKVTTRKLCLSNSCPHYGLGFYRVRAKIHF
jgi:hypothetical protein